MQIELTGLTKRYGPLTAVRDLSARIAPGQVTAFLGPNGAGKTTTLRMLLGLVRPDAGDASFGGRRYRELADPRRTVGAVLGPDGYHPGRSGRDHLRIVATAAGFPPRRVEEVLDLVELTGDGDRRVRGTPGHATRLGLASACSGTPGGDRRRTGQRPGSRGIMDPGPAAVRRPGEGPGPATWRSPAPPTGSWSSTGARAFDGAHRPHRRSHGRRVASPPSSHSPLEHGHTPLVRSEILKVTSLRTARWLVLAPDPPVHHGGQRHPGLGAAHAELATGPARATACTGVGAIRPVPITRAPASTGTGRRWTPS